MSDPSSSHRAVPVSRFVAFFAIAAGGLAIDLATKSWIFAKLGMPDRFERFREHDLVVIPGFFNLTTNLNHGGLFGFGQGWSLGLAGLSVLAAGFVLWWLFVAGAARDWMLTLALALVTAGIFGNLYDRLGLWNDARQAGAPVYAVRDWLDVYYGEHHWPIFNIADSLLVVGACLLFCQIWLSQAHAGHDGKAADAPAAEQAAATADRSSSAPDRDHAA